LKHEAVYLVFIYNSAAITVTVNGKPIRVRAHVSRPNGDQVRRTIAIGAVSALPIAIEHKREGEGVRTLAARFPRDTCWTVTLHTQGAATVLEACKMAGDFVPTLCHHPSIKHTEHSATCRLCMVDVTEVKGAGVQRCNQLSAIYSVPTWLLLFFK
jgi:hypothetical protein